MILNKEYNKYAYDGLGNFFSLLISLVKFRFCLILTFCFHLCNEAYFKKTLSEDKIWYNVAD